MLVQELECAHAVDGMRAVEPLDLRAFGMPNLV